jgi:hypothetical protein
VSRRKYKSVGVLMIFDDNDPIVNYNDKERRQFRKDLKKFFNEHNYKGVAYYKSMDKVKQDRSGLHVRLNNDDKQAWKECIKKK